MVTVVFDTLTYERAEAAARRKGRSMYDLLNAQVVDYAATVPLEDIDADVPTGEDGYPVYTVNWNAPCIINPAEIREDGVALFSHKQVSDD